MMPLEKYYKKLFNATAAMKGKNITCIDYASNKRDFYTVFKYDVGNHDKFVFAEDTECWVNPYTKECPDLIIYKNSEGDLAYHIPNVFMVREVSVRAALEEYFGTVWNITWRQWIDRYHAQSNKRYVGLHRYNAYQEYVSRCRYAKKVGTKEKRIFAEPVPF